MRLVTSTLMFLAGFVSNLACQTVRATTNALGSVLFAAIGSVGLLVGLLRLLGGGKDKGLQLCSLSWVLLRKGIVMLLRSAVQAIGVATMATPLLRAAQASSEKFAIQGLYSPSSGKRSTLQKLLGLNSWQREDRWRVVDEGGPKRKPAPKPRVALEPPKEKARPKLVNLPAAHVAPAVPQEKARPKVVDLPPPKVASVKVKVEKKVRRPRKPKISEELKRKDWENLAEMYFQCKTQRDADRIRLAMASRHPLLYLDALEAASSKPKKAHSRAI